MEREGGREMEGREPPHLKEMREGGRETALTPTISKLLSGILRDRWLRHMRLNNYLDSDLQKAFLLNNYLDSDLQKAFLPTIPGVSEH